MPLGDGVPLELGRQIGVPLKDIILPLLALTVWKWLQIDTDLLNIITSTGDVLFRFVNINDLKRPWTRKRGVLVIFCNFWLQCTFQPWIETKWLEIDQNNPHVQFSALSVNFSCLSPDPLGSKRPTSRASKTSTPCKSVFFTALAWKQLRMDADMLSLS